jgi:hypothetical protein
MEHNDVKEKSYEEDSMKLIRLLPLFVSLIFLLAACGEGFIEPSETPAPAVTEAPVATEAPATEAPATEPPTEVSLPLTPTSAAHSLDEQMAQIDAVLKRTLSASIAYNKPESMALDQTVTIELLLNPALSPQVLSTQVTELGQVTSASLQVTPRMKAVLLANDDTAFIIKPIHDTPEQLISKTDTTRWAWMVTARKGGVQRLTLVIYRLVEYEGQGYWREVETYKADVNIEVTLIQRVKSLDWGWFIGVFVTAIAIPALWRWVDQRKKQVEQKIPPKHQKKN